MRNFDVELPVNTIRAWTIGMLLCTVGSSVNMLFSLRNPNVLLTTFVIQLISYPIGLGWDLIFPDRVFSIFGFKFNLKPGRFNFKEHVVIVVMSNVCLDGEWSRPREIPPTRANRHINRQRMAAELCMPPTLLLRSKSGTGSRSDGGGRSS